VKKGLENIENIFKDVFDGFESNVDPNVWSNVQNAIGSGTTGGLDPNVTNIAGTASKTVALKIVTAVVIVSAVITSIVYIGTENEVQENNILEKSADDINTIHKVTEQEQDPFIEENKTNLGTVSDKGNERTSENDLNQNVVAKAVSEDVTESILDNDLPQKQENTNTVNSDNEVDKGINENKEQVNDQTKEITQEQEEPEILKAKIIVNTFSGKAPLDVDFEVTGDGIVSYLWDFGDEGPISSQESPYYRYNEPGVYQVILTIIDKNANTKTLVQFIEVEKDVTSFLDKINTAFSPNGDGINDILKITGENIKVFNARVLSIRGKTIFEWNNINGYWDGKDQFGNKVPEGAYFLDVYAKGDDGMEHKPRLTINVYD